VAVCAIEPGPSTTLAQVEIRWSARMGVVGAGASPGALATLPQRWIFTLARKAGVKTDAARGMATARCGNCGAPLGDSVQPTCEHCGATLNDGAHDWVLTRAEPFELWTARAQVQMPLHAASGAPAAARDTVLDAAERQRLLYTMAAMAAADGSVDDRERRMLKLCAERWGVPFQNVEQALNADPALFERLVPTPGPGGESFLRSLVQMALVDGKVDRQERRMLEAAAARLGLTERLPELLARFGLG
jgi:tellurite resistance protein